MKFVNTMENFNDLIDRFKASDKSYLEYTLNQRGMWSPALLLLTGTTITDDDTVIYRDGISTVTSKLFVDIFFFCYEKWLVNPNTSLFSMCEAYFDGDMSVPDYRKGPKEVHYDCGQSKILVGAVEAFSCYEKDTAKVLVIGSAGLSVSGATYEVLAEILTDHGISGEMDLYDNTEKPGQAIVGDFTINRHGEYYAYDTLSKYDVVLEDAYQNAEIRDVSQQSFYFNVPQNLPDGQNKFLCYIEDGEGIVAAGPVLSHRSLGIPSDLIIGGGTYYKRGKNIVFVSNVSGTYGAISVENIRANFCAYNVTFKRKGRYWMPEIFNGLTNRVSIKWVGEDAPDGDVRDQVFYTGNEVRVFKNIPKIRDKDPFIEFSCGCRTCSRVSLVASSLPRSNTALASRTFVKIFSLNGKACRPIQGLSKIGIEKYFGLYASRVYEKAQALNDVGNYLFNFKADSVLVDMIKNGKIKEVDINGKEHIMRVNTILNIQDTTFPRYLHQMTPIYGKMDADCMSFCDSMLSSYQFANSKEVFLITSYFDPVCRYVLFMSKEHDYREYVDARYTVLFRGTGYVLLFNHHAPDLYPEEYLTYKYQEVRTHWHSRRWRFKLY
jgi:hypothetical protein